MTAPMISTSLDFNDMRRFPEQIPGDHSGLLPGNFPCVRPPDSRAPVHRAA